ncbi:MAG: hypothetical protein C5B58_13620 [Acidobacteria bacterium]|nr:MAG: hypothetical protein C5B58_13620 [Acidobacteriota bacterium]
MVIGAAAAIRLRLPQARAVALRKVPSLSSRFAYGSSWLIAHPHLGKSKTRGIGGRARPIGGVIHNDDKMIDSRKARQ